MKDENRKLSGDEPSSANEPKIVPAPTEKGDGVVLLPCPFCGVKDRSVTGASGHSVAVVHRANRPEGFVPYWTVECDGCGSEGPAEDDSDRAIAAWNHRAMIAATQQATGEGGVHLDAAQTKAIAHAALDAGCHVWRGARLAMAKDGEVIGYPCFSRADMAELARLYREDGQQAVSPPEGVGWTVAERAIRHLSRLVRVYGDMQDGNGNTPTEIRHAERFLESFGSLAPARPHRNAADGGSSSEGGET